MADYSDLTGLEMLLGSVSHCLWDARELLERTQHLLTVQRALAVTGEIDALSGTSVELDGVTAQLRQLELVRSGHVEVAAATLGLPPGPTLRQLAAAAPEPWDEILREHRAALLVLAAEVDSARAAANAALRGPGGRS